MTSKEIRQKFLQYFKERGHTVVPSSSLVPDDPSVLLTTAGMQQFKPYFLGKADPIKDFGSKNTVSIQKSFRTSDIEEVGDESHLTFFEMLGNFSFGGYFKEKAIEYAYDFITKEMGLEVDYVTVFDSQKVDEKDWRKDVPFDAESVGIWREKVGIPEKKIKKEGVDNFWGPTGFEGPCGPTTEIYIKNKQGKSIEVWNVVFNEFYCDKNKKLSKLEIPGVDTGMGLERLAMVVQNVPTIFDTDLFSIPFGSLFDLNEEKSARIIADHMRGIVFLLADGVLPSNKEEGYILRRLIRRLLVNARRVSIKIEKLNEFLDNLVGFYGEFYPELTREVKEIRKEFNAEAGSFEVVLDKGIKAFNKKYPPGDFANQQRGKVSGKDAFDMYQSYGFPPEIIKEIAEERGYIFDEEEFKKEFEKHKEVSRIGQEKKFGGHGLVLDTGELKAATDEEYRKVVRLHTATHLLQQALRDVLGSSVRQAGSDITAERTRFDFYFDRPLTAEELKKVESIVNEKISENLPVNFKEMPKEEAEKTSALRFFKEKYPDIVKVYYIGPDLDHAYSKEFCGGPHVSRTGEIGGIEIFKEESVGRGVRRIRARLKQ